eukprot:238968-Prorocentrum_minimum.AAC.1
MKSNVAPDLGNLEGDVDGGVDGGLLEDGNGRGGRDLVHDDVQAGDGRAGHVVVRLSGAPRRNQQLHNRQVGGRQHQYGEGAPVVAGVEHERAAA